MANDQVPQSPREMRFGFTQQSVYGTAEADAVAVTEIDCEPFHVNRDIKQIEVRGSHGTRERNEASIITLDDGCVPSFTVDIVVKKLELADLLAAFFQNVVEGESTPFDKTFTLGATQPDFEADAGYFYTWFVRDPVAAKSIKIKDCVLKALTISIVGGEPVRASCEWVGMGLPAVNATPSGTWTVNPTTGLFYRDYLDRITIDFGSGAVNFRLMEGEISLSRDIVGIGQDGSGGNQVLHLANPVHTATIKVVKDDDWEDVRTNHAACTAIDFNLGWGHATPGTDDGDFDIQGHAIIDGPAGEEIGFDEPMAGTVKCHMCETATDEACQVVMADNVDKTW